MRSVLSVAGGVLLVAVVAVVLLDPGLALGGGDGSGTARGSSPSPSKLVAAGRQLFITGCSSCHGMDANGTHDVAPSLHGVGAMAAHFYLSTGRMPMPQLDVEPIRTHPRYSRQEIRALVAYVGSLGGPGIPRVDLADGSISEGQRLFTSTCAGCHQSVARGGIVTGAFVPPLTEATPTQIAEAIRIGPYLMPRFGMRMLTDRQVASIAKFVEASRSPHSPGGAGIGYIGPVPEGMVTWLAALPVLLLVTRLIGKRSER
jgi:ubiquinol-cytochrome c reductase cytochrome c subunit